MALRTPIGFSSARRISYAIHLIAFGSAHLPQGCADGIPARCPESTPLLRLELQSNLHAGFALSDLYLTRAIPERVGKPEVSGDLRL
jgi:hypothetical protein